MGQQLHSIMVTLFFVIHDADFDLTIFSTDSIILKHTPVFPLYDYLVQQIISLFSLNELHINRCETAL